MALQSTGSSPNNTIIAAGVVAAILQLAISPQISILGGAFNFMVAFALAASVAAEPSTAVYVGFCSGLFYDLTSSAPVGLMALLLTVACFLTAHATFGTASGANLESLRIVVVAVLALNLVYALALLLLGSETSIVQALGVHGLSCAVLDAVALVPFIAVIGPRTQSGVFSGRGGGQKTFATPRRASGRSTRKRGSGGPTLQRSSSKGGSRGRHAKGKRSSGLRFKDQR